VTLAALVACATSDGEGASLDPMIDGGATVVDAASPEGVDAAPQRDVFAPVWSACNDHGWCETELPDPNLTFIDVWPFEERAFAVAESDTLGTKVLEWTETAQAWSYIDDNSQNAYGSGQYAGKIYAPSENELYFTTAPGIVYRGTRESVSAPFTWESTRLPYDGPTYADRDPGRAWTALQDTVKRYVPALGVTGTSADDVYAWFGNRIFRRTSEDGGPPTWISEFVTEDPSSAASESFYILNASPATSDEIWFVGGHGPIDAATGFTGCPSLFRRTASGYSVVLDSTFSDGPMPCSTKPGTIQPTYYQEIPGVGAFELPLSLPGWAAALAPVAPGAVVVTVGLNFYYVDTESNVARINGISGVNPPTPNGVINDLHSVAHVDDRLWFSAHGIVFGSEIKPDAWRVSLGSGTPPSKGASIEMTSVAMKGRYLNEPLYQVRGTSANNLWAVGNRYALHKKP